VSDTTLGPSERSDAGGSGSRETVPPRRAAILEQRLDRRHRRRRRVSIGLAVLVAAAFVALEAVTVLAIRDQDASRRELASRRTDVRRRIRTTEDSTSSTSEVIGEEVGQRDMARWFVSHPTAGRLGEHGDR
jgi:hypothetical protein